MTATTLLIPAKTFIVGEYAAIKGENALLVTTQPCFSMHIANGDPSHNFPEGSPAEQLYRKNKEAFSTKQILFKDPYQGIGGLGASSAQFLGLYHYLKHNALYEDYLSFAYQGNGYPPSAYDVFAQQMGRISRICRNENTYERYSWPFENLTFALFHTGYKVQTHKHLGALNEVDISDLKTVARASVFAFKQKDEKSFIRSVNDYHQALVDIHKVTENSLDLVDDLMKPDFCLAAKGCGALGADIILTLVKPRNLDALKAYASSKGLTFIADSDLLSEGLSEKTSMKEEAFS